MISNLYTFLRSELELSPARWRALGRIVVGCIVALILIMTLRIPEGGWVILTIFIVSMGDTGASMKRAVQRELSIGAGCAVAIGLLVLFHQQPWILIPCIAFVIGVSVYLSRTSVAPSIPILGALCMILARGGVDVTASEGVDTALWRFVDISLGNIIGTFCQAYVWPERPQQLLLQGMAASLRASADRLNQTLLPKEDINTDEGSLALSDERVMNSLAQWISWLDNAEYAHREIRNFHHEMVNLIGDINQIAIASQQSARAVAYLALHDQDVHFSPSVQEQLIAIQERCKAYASAIEDRAWTHSTEALPPLSESVSNTFVAEEGGRHQSGTDLTRIQSTFQGTMLSSALTMAETLDTLVESVGFMKTEKPIHEHKNPGQPDAAVASLVSPSSLFRLRTEDFTSTGPFKLNRADLASAAKAALGAIIAYVYLNAIDWPGGITAVVTAVLVSLDNYGAMILKSTLRVAGATVGGIGCMLVILFVMPNITSLPPYLVATGLVCALGAWVQTGSTRISYAGLQIGLITGLALATSHQPDINLLPFLDRLLGIFTGLVAVLLVYGSFGEIRARIWVLDNGVETLRLMAKGAMLGLTKAEVGSEKERISRYRYEAYRRISFGYRLLTEASYEDWFSRKKEKNQEDTEFLSTVLDDTRAVQRILMSIVWNRLDFQKLDAPHGGGQDALESIGRTVPAILEALARRLENPEVSDTSALEAAAAFSEQLRAAESVLRGEELADDASPSERNYHRLLRAQLGFYQQLEIRLTRMAETTRSFSISGDRFSLLARIRGSERREGAPTIRPA
ncbi:MAG: FUSC family protein [Myxococcota bacterium]|nr:FUSC family protein [Myxococcota bacterium]